MSFVHKLRIACSCCLAAFLFAVVAAYADSIPKRTISTAPSITEILYALGMGDRVVGVSEYCRYPEEATNKPRIGSYLNPNLELLLSLKPDLVFVEEVNARALAALPAKGFQKITLQHRSIADIYTSIETIAEAEGEVSAGADLISTLRKELARIEAHTKKLPRRKVLFLVGRTPGTLQGMMAAGNGTYINELIRIAGGINCMEDAGPAYPAISLETLLARNPAVIVDRGDMAMGGPETAAHEANVRRLWSTLGSVDAVKHGRVHPVSEDYWVVPGPRVVKAALTLARMIHPEAGL